jgi:hypothetical protein
MDLRRTILRSVAATAAGAVPLWVGASPAAAESYTQRRSFEHYFTNGAGERTVCTVEGGATLQRYSPSDPFRADADTSAYRFEDVEADCGAMVSVRVRYLTSSDRPVTGGSEARDRVLWFADDDVAGEFRSVHRVEFLSCQADCVATFTIQPK